MEGKLILRKDGKPNEFGEYPVAIQYCTQGKAVRKTTDIKVRSRSTRTAVNLIIAEYHHLLDVFRICSLAVEDNGKFHQIKLGMLGVFNLDMLIDIVLNIHTQAGELFLSKLPTKWVTQK